MANHFVVYPLVLVPISVHRLRFSSPAPTSPFLPLRPTSPTNTSTCSVCPLCHSTSMPQDANFRFIDNGYALSDDGRRIIRSHVATHKPRLPALTSHRAPDGPKQRRKRHKKQKVYELHLLDTSPAGYRPCPTTDDALRVTGVDPFESLAIPADSYLDPVLRHCQFHDPTSRRACPDTRAL